MKFVAGLLLFVAPISYASPPAQPSDHVWSKQGKVFYLVAGNEDVGRIRPRFVYSPDRTSWLQLDFVRGNGDGDAIPVVTLVGKLGKVPIALDKDWAQVEVLWSADSTGFALTGVFNAYTNSTRLYRIRSNSIERIPLDSVWKDMAQTYPICKAAQADPVDCRREASGKDFNYATVAWSSPTRSVIMSEVPCSSTWGGIMCQVKAYEVDIATDRIVSRMNAREFKKKWQSSLAWRVNIPDPPQWKSAP